MINKVTYTAAAAKSLQSCPTLRTHRWQPTRLPYPWDSPDKNTGVPQKGYGHKKEQINPRNTDQNLSLHYF